MEAVTVGESATRPKAGLLMQLESTALAATREAPMLFNGETVGEGGSLSFDIAVDPLECTSLCAAGMPGALTTIAMAESGSMWEPGPAFYMDKLLGRGVLRGVIDINETPENNLERAAEALGIAVS